MRHRNRFLTLILTVACIISLVGCGKTSLGGQSFSGLNSIADLATLRSYYHNVIEVRTNGTQLFFDLVQVGYKKAWFEYSGYVDMGVDVTQVDISKPDENNVVRVKLPAVEIFDLNIDENTMQMKSYEGGAFQRITFEEIDGARTAAQQNMKEQVEKDRVIPAQAKEHARALIESYIVNVGESTGQEFTVEFVDSDG